MSQAAKSSQPMTGQLRRVEAVTEAGLAHLDLEDLLDELLERIRGLLTVDTAAVLLIDTSGQYLVATAAKGLEGQVRQGTRIPVGQGFAGRIASFKEPVVIQNVRPGDLLNPVLRQRGVRSLLGVPLVVSGEVIGVLHVGSLTLRHFTDDDIALLQLVADRAALATQARLTRSDRDAAAALQRSLTPTRLPTIPGLEVSARYVAGKGGGVGGDWYDLFVLPSGALGLALGDVAGSGLPAAVVMGRLRSALRAYALETDDPADVLTRLDRKVQHFETGTLATLLYATIDPASGRFEVSVAGHPVPAVAQPCSPSRFLDLPIDLPIGVRVEPRPRRSRSFQIPEDGLICCYTDGLVERRGSNLDEGMERLRRALTVTPSVEDACATVMASMLGGEAPADDIALVMVRRDIRGTG